MKSASLLLAALALAGAALASAPVDPSRPMVTGRGNVTARPTQVIVTNQTAAKAPAPATEKKKSEDKSANDTVDLEKIVVTGSLIKPPAAPAKK